MTPGPGHGGPEVEHETRATVLRVGGHGVAQSVGAELSWSIDLERHVRADPGFDEERLFVQVTMNPLSEPGFHRWNDRRDRHVNQVFRFHPLPAKELVKPHPDLIGGAFGVGRQTPMGTELFTVEEADHRVRVPDIERQQELLQVLPPRPERYNPSPGVSRERPPNAGNPALFAP